MGAPMERWSIDLCGPFPTVNDYKYLFTAIDPFSKFAIVIPIRSKTADVVAKTIVQNIFSAIWSMFRDTYRPGV